MKRNGMECIVKKLQNVMKWNVKEWNVIEWNVKEWNGM